MGKWPASTSARARSVHLSATKATFSIKSSVRGRPPTSAPGAASIGRSTSSSPTAPRSRRQNLGRQPTVPPVGSGGTACVWPVRPVCSETVRPFASSVPRGPSPRRSGHKSVSSAPPGSIQIVWDLAKRQTAAGEAAGVSMTARGKKVQSCAVTRVVTKIFVFVISRKFREIFF